MRKRSGQVYSRESSATLQLTVSLLYLEDIPDVDFLIELLYDFDIEHSWGLTC